ncbi:prolyl oligopeptidase family serine peptidase [Solihabitans fulvus]|uniref:Prolyl oligopeptidase family serine peptidase n=1 Tax=Solihabitans fulvus TaxID=1892852 RepID=A0A5B2XPR7_9PSEU|nr:DUF6351 family protein [Solihabitans fulvus]KAA2265737.1 prolyl oligopeptidase family serine peptidase [Solihabitans fulvus]
MRRRLLIGIAFVLAALVGAPSAGWAAPGDTVVDGTLPDGAAYRFEVPAGWNGTLLLFSHGYRGPGSPNPAADGPDAQTDRWLLAHGYALAGSSYATTGWAVAQAVPDQAATAELFAARFGHPRRTIAWGSSLGGLVTGSLLDARPDLVTGALPMCGVLDPVGAWNQALDAEFVFATLAAPTANLRLVGITDPVGNLAGAQAALDAAQATPQGRARIALTAAVADVPAWSDPSAPEPAAGDLAAQEHNQYVDLRAAAFPFAFALRAELEARAGGVVSWNTGVDYRRQLARSADRSLALGLYRAAGLPVEADLAALAAAPRVAADRRAVAYLAANHEPSGRLAVPVLTLHTTGDGLVAPEQERAYRNAVAQAGDGRLLRQVFVHRAGHCAFTMGEAVAALRALEHRLDTGRWDGATEPSALNAAASAVGGPVAPAFLRYRPGPPERTETGLRDG